MLILTTTSKTLASIAVWLLGTYEAWFVPFSAVWFIQFIYLFRELKDSKELTDTLQNQFASGAYTHHQKSVICDAPGSAEARPRLVAFVGGLDLTGGRYDTPNFELFKTLLHEHKDDFRNSNAKVVNPLEGPREPWHDIHSKVEGRIAYDVFFNFYERWARQGQQGKPFEDLQNVLQSDINIDGPLNIDPARAWNCQFFRSITDDSAKFLVDDRISCVSHHDQ